ncbi:hypothetical protein [Caballeronia ptereochthonis]|uniref:hypothetical protein n=1 Tax=Caballeronia ptereochthonis TaxID=1777144 RepID=UPI000AC55980|nr:hypothetical protein [Caballeronia ptereochthonis]
MNGLNARTLKVSRPVQGLLAVTIGLIVFVQWRASKDETPARPAPAPAAASASAASAASAAAPVQAAGSGDASAPAEAAAPASEVNLFPGQTWQPPPPPPPPPVPAAKLPPPEPPPLPFVVRSLWLDPRGDFYAVLAGAGKEFALCAACQKKGFLRRGDVILNAYRIEEIDRQHVKFTYLPLKRQQQLSFGEPR